MQMQGGPGGPGGARGGQRPPQKPKNLKVLPENTDLRKVMRGYEAALGVECEFCHVAPDPVTHRSDKASDANPMKEQARAMIQMTDDLNTKYMTLLAKNTPTYDAKDAEVTCGTCHRGQKHPAAFVAPPRAEHERRPGGPEGASPTGSPVTRQ
jgi:hypothetical protein